MKQAKQKEKERNHLNAFKKGKFLRKNETSNPYKSHYLGYEETRLVRRKSALHCRGTRIPDAATFATPSKYIYIRKEREDFRPVFPIIHVISSSFSRNSTGPYPRLCILAASQLSSDPPFAFHQNPSLSFFSPLTLSLRRPSIHASIHPSIFLLEDSSVVDSLAKCIARDPREKRIEREGRGPVESDNRSSRQRHERIYFTHLW